MHAPQLIFFLNIFLAYKILLILLILPIPQWILMLSILLFQGKPWCNLPVQWYQPWITYHSSRSVLQKTTDSLLNVTYHFPGSNLLKSFYSLNHRFGRKLTIYSYFTALTSVNVGLLFGYIKYTTSQVNTKLNQETGLVGSSLTMT